MAGSRLDKLGTIFTRVNGLIKSGAMKIEDRPIWYDVYRAFPPESEPYYSKPAPMHKVPDVFFPEDVFRAKFHKKVRGQLPPIDLKETQSKPDATKIAVDMVNKDQLLSIDQVVNTLKNNGVLLTFKTPSPMKNVDSDVNDKNEYKLEAINEFKKLTKPDRNN